MDRAKLLKIVVDIRAMQLYYHYCHNLTYGENFMSDHGMFAAFYGELAAQYDQIAEYTVATLGNKAFDVVTITKAVAEHLSDLEVENMTPEQMFKEGLKLEKNLQKDLATLDKVASIGMKNLIGDLAQTADVRIYKVQQRLK